MSELSKQNAGGARQTADIEFGGFPDIRQFFDAVRNLNKLEPLDERAFVEKILLAANAANPQRPRFEVVARTCSELELSGYAPGLTNAFYGQVIVKGNLLADLIKRLEAILTNLSMARSALLPKLGQLIEIALVPMVDSKGANASVRYRLIPRNFSTAAAYALLLMLDPNRTFGRDLCRCEFQECNDFFLSVPNPSGGPRRRKFCCAEHMERDHNFHAKFRVKKNRRANKLKGIKRKN